MDYYKMAIDKFSETCELITFKDEEEWLKMRQLGIGGSDVASIMGHSPWKTAIDIYNSKKEEQEQLGGDAINFGRKAESIIVELFKLKYGNIYAVLDFKNIMFRNFFIPFFQASLDGGLVDKRDNSVGVLEVKTKQDKVDGWYDEDKNPTIPKYYLDQAIHYFNTTNAEFVVFITLINYRTDFGDISMKLLAPRVIYKRDLIDYMNKVKDKCIDFWMNYVEKNIKPKDMLSFN